MAKQEINHIIALMREYQKKEGITDECMTNAYYLFNYIKQYFPDEKVEVMPVMVIGENNEGDPRWWMGHLVVVWTMKDEEYILESSYEVSSLKKKEYFADFKLLWDYIKHTSDDETKNKIKSRYRDFPPFIDRAKEINRGKIIISNLEFYQGQVRYIREKI
jgi:hypothetical protein